jgi:MoxR-like ATPase
MAQKKDSALTRYGRDLTELAKQGKLHDVVGRDEEIKTVIAVLTRTGKSNAVLVGEAGVGKTAIVEGLACRIHRKSKEVSALREYRVVSLRAGELLAGTNEVGELERRMTAILREADPRHTILFIDELHQVVAAGAAIGQIQLSEILKAPLDSGVKCIGATTSGEYEQYIEPNSAFARRFVKVVVKELSKASTLSVLGALRENLQAKYHVEITADALKEAVKLSASIAEKCWPDKAIDLVENTMSRARNESAEKVDKDDIVASFGSLHGDKAITHGGDSEVTTLQECRSQLRTRRRSKRRALLNKWREFLGRLLEAKSDPEIAGMLEGTRERRRLDAAAQWSHETRSTLQSLPAWNVWSLGDPDYLLICPRRQANDRPYPVMNGEDVISLTLVRDYLAKLGKRAELKFVAHPQQGAAVHKEIQSYKGHIVYICFNSMPIEEWNYLRECGFPYLFDRDTQSLPLLRYGEDEIRSPIDSEKKEPKDVGLIAKFRRANKATYAFIVAGLHGTGTWGAAKLLTTPEKLAEVEGQVGDNPFCAKLSAELDPKEYDLRKASLEGGVMELRHEN